ncbi:lipopolysaccharide biosynthesis protein [Butyrivibrio sp. MC2013]|uniref:lipopolysaccharide biosynthesis protein n=1 Tax=Butyrivibrio sp. MC2013 TaxID=1280686 RepID=UPI00041A2F07|nr:oligosaccharide flippase family protein [Butyrivibrio sp. MC2013]
MIGEKSIKTDGAYMKRESFFKGLFTVGVGTFLNLLVGLLTTPIITRLVDPTEYGQFSIFTLYTNLAMIFMCLGLDQGLVRFYYRSEDIAYKRKLIKEVLILPALVSLVVLCIYLSGAVTEIIPIEFDLTVTTLLAIHIMINVIYRFCSLTVRLNHNNTLYAILNVTQKLSYVLLAIVLLKIRIMSDIHSLVISLVVSFAVCLVLALLSQWKCFYGKTSPVDVDEIKLLVKYSFPFILSTGIATLFQSLDKLSLKHFCSYREVGIYSSAMMFISLFSVVQSSFNTVWAPKSIEHYTQNPEDKEFYKRAFEAVTLVMFILGITLVLFKDVFVFVLGAKYRDAAYIMPFLIFEPIMYTISETTVGGINFTQRSSLHIIVALIACIVNFIGNTILVPLIGGKGAAISTGISYIVFLALRTYFGEKSFYIGFNIKKLILVTLVSIVFAGYNTFLDFDIFSIILAMLCYILVIFEYRGSLRWIIHKIAPALLKRINK